MSSYRQRSWTGAEPASARASVERARALREVLLRELELTAGEIETRVGEQEPKGAIVLRQRHGGR